MNVKNYVGLLYVTIGYEQEAPTNLEDFLKTPVSFRVYRGRDVEKRYNSIMYFNGVSLPRNASLKNFESHFFVLKGLFIESSDFDYSMVKELIRRNLLRDVSTPHDRYKVLVGTKKLFNSKNTKVGYSYKQLSYLPPYLIRNK